MTLETLVPIYTCLLSFIFSCIVATGQGNKLQEYILHQARSLDFSQPGHPNLSFLDSALRNTRIVALGESSHGTEEYSQEKFQLIQYLHEKLGFNAILFESPMVNGSYVNMASDTSAGQLVRNSIQSVWHTHTVNRLFRYVKTRGMIFGGFDPQFIYSPYRGSFFSSVFHDYPAIKNTVLNLEARLAQKTGNTRKHYALKDSFSTAYRRIVDELGKANLSPVQQWAKQIMTISSSYYARIDEGDQRDSCMARNIIWLAEKMYPGEKIIIWAHNTHIDKEATRPKRLMGKLLAAHFGSQYYAVGLYMVNGSTALNDRRIIPVKAPLKGSLEEMLSAPGFRSAFIETAHPVFNQHIPTWHWGKDRQKLNLYKSFNAVILINGVQAPGYF